MARIPEPIHSILVSSNDVYGNEECASQAVLLTPDVLLTEILVLQDHLLVAEVEAIQTALDLAQEIIQEEVLLLEEVQGVNHKT